MLTSLMISPDALAAWNGMASNLSLYPPSRSLLQDSLYRVCGEDVHSYRRHATWWLPTLPSPTWEPGLLWVFLPVGSQRSLGLSENNQRAGSCLLPTLGGEIHGWRVGVKRQELWSQRDPGFSEQQVDCKKEEGGCMRLALYAG